MAKAGCYRRDQLNFNAGELSPLLHYRVDLEPVSRGTRQMQNMIPRKYGNAERRVGTRFIAEVKDSTAVCRMIPFNYSVEDTIAIEFGGGYFRFFKDGAAVESSDVPYEVTNPYSADEVFDVQFWQINDIMLFTHPDHPPYRLSRYSDTNWTMELVPFDEPVFKDQNITTTTITPSGTSGNITLTASSSIFHSAMVGGYFKLGHRRANDRISLSLKATGDSSTLSVKGKFVFRTTGTWSGDLLIQRYENSTWNTVYSFASDKDQNFNQEIEQDDDDTNQWRMSFTYNDNDNSNPKAYIESEEAYVYGWAKVTSYTSGTVVSATVSEPFQATTATKVWMEGAWSPHRGYPRAVAYFQDRIFYAGTSHQPQTIWASVSGDYYNFEGITGVTTIQDDYAVAKTMGSSERVYIQWMEQLGTSLIVGTSSGEFSVSGSNGGDDPITANNFTIKLQTPTGDANIKPIRVGSSLLHVQRNRKRLYEMNYSISSYGYEDSDITQFSEHITGDKGGIVGMAYQRQPDSAVWCVRDDGVLLCCVYDQAQKVVAWSRMVTQGEVESIASIYGENGDELWMIVKRTIGVGTEKRYVERLLSVPFTSKLDCWFSDAGTSYSTAAASNVESIVAVITTQPISQSVNYGGTAVFSIEVSTNGGDIPFDATYQWLYNGIEISGATDDEYSFVVDSIDDGGIFSCVVTTRFGSVTSEGAVLLVGRYLSVTEMASLSTTPYFVDETGAIILDSVSESSTLSITPHLTDEENGIISTLDTESATLSITPYFLDEEDA